MPTLAVSKTFLFNLLGRAACTQEEFDNLCFEFGVELDEVTSEREIFRREHAALLKDPAQKKQIEAQMAQISADELYKIDTPANRYDLLSAEGMAIALRVFTGTLPVPRYRVLPPTLTMTVKKTTRNIRDFVICAVLRNITFTDESYNSFIDFQEKLHGGLARKRTLCSVGTHDLDKVKGPNFTYECVAKADIKFSPLNQKGRVLDCAGDGLQKFYNPVTERHISKYVPLIAHLDKYPIVFDADRTIMSLPPIINSDASRIEKSTTNVFIECTAPEYHKASSLVNQMVTAFSYYCQEQFTIEAVNVKYEDPTALIETKRMLHTAAIDAAKFRGDDVEVARLEKQGQTAANTDTDVTPNLETRVMNIDVPTMNSRVGINVDAKRCAELLGKMMLHSTAVDEKTVQVQIPANRSDILHPCDLVEDCAIAYGYDNITYQEVPTRSAGTQTPMNKLAHLLRLEVAAAGYTEMLTFSLCSRDEAFKFLRREDRGTAVVIANPQTVEFQVCRPSLLPGTLKTFQHNKSQALPLKLFEVSEVVVKDAATRTGARNERHFAALHAQPESSSFEDIQGLCEYVLRKIGVEQRTFDRTDADMIKDGHSAWYSFRPFDDEKDAYFPGRAMEVLLTTVADAKSGRTATERVGALGVLHPKVLRSKLLDPTSTIDMPVPCSYTELSLEPLIGLPH
jgi:phenylalanyl-tRNA synthetase beta chain